MNTVTRCGKKFVYLNEFQKQYLLHSFDKVIAFEQKFKTDWNLVILWLKRVMCEEPDYTHLIYHHHVQNGLVCELNNFLRRLSNEVIPAEARTLDAYNFIFSRVLGHFRKVIIIAQNDLIILNIFHQYKTCCEIGIFNIKKLNYTTNFGCRLYNFIIFTKRNIQQRPHLVQQHK